MGIRLRIEEIEEQIAPGVSGNPLLSAHPGVPTGANRLPNPPPL